MFSKVHLIDSEDIEEECSNIMQKNWNMYISFGNAAMPEGIPRQASQHMKLLCSSFLYKFVFKLP